MRSVSAGRQKRLFINQWRKYGSHTGYYIPSLQNGGLNDGYTYDQVRDVILDASGNVANNDNNAFTKTKFKYLTRSTEERRRVNRGSFISDTSTFTIYVLPQSASAIKKAWRVIIDGVHYTIVDVKASVNNDAVIAVSLAQASPSS